MQIVPITFKEASEFVRQYHRHHKAPTGCKFCIGYKEGEQIVGVAICGRPVSRHLDNGKRLKLTACAPTELVTPALNCMARVFVSLVKWGTQRLLHTFLQARTARA